MLNTDVAERINRSLEFQDQERLAVCDFLDHKKLFYYFSHKKNPDAADRVKAYHQLGIDICWRFERRRTKRVGLLKQLVEKYTLRNQQFDLLTQTELTREFDDFAEQQKLFAPYTYLAMSVPGCLNPVHYSLGLENFREQMYVDLIEFERIFDRLSENLYLRAKRFAAHNFGNIFFIMDTLANDQGLIFSQQFLKMSYLPRVKKAIVPLKQKNIKVILHSPGNISEIIPELIEIGINGIHPVESSSGMDSGMLRKRYANSLLLLCGISLAGKKDEILECTKRIIHSCTHLRGYFIGSSFGINNSVELKDIFSFYTAIKEYL
ncbi:MAG: hypothetical protein DRP78_07095 [Candidatus Omnitrophota bacterium]|nr:MAG: hypothetical protein DRP78_07095 [Candidatus Omnitrophota bacterium]